MSMSDHYMVYCVRKFNSSLIRDHKAIKTRIMKKFSKSGFHADVLRICWEDIIKPCHGVDELVLKWTSVFSTLIDKHASNRELQVSERYCLWFILQLKNLIRKKYNLKRNAIKHNSTTQMTAYKTLRNQANTLNRELIKQYFAEKIPKEKGNMKGTWKTVNQLVNDRSKSTNISFLDIGGNHILNSSAIANSMNGYLCSISNDLTSELRHKPNPLLNGDYSVNMSGATFRFKGIDA